MAKGYKKPPEIDIRKVGPQSYRDLQALNARNLQASQQYFQNKYGFSSFKMPQLSSWQSDIYSGPVQSPIWQQSGGEDYVGKSYWDQHDYTVDDLELMQQNPNEFRARNQGWAMQLLNGTGKMLEIAGSTLLNSTIGLVAGLGTGFYNLAKGDNFLRGFWDNAVTNSLQEMNDYFEKELPNYYTQQENESPWYSQILTPNFIGDKLLKNMGFTIGAIGAAYLTGGLGLGTALGKWMQGLGYADKTIRATTNIANGVVNTMLSAAGEASIEAHQAMHDGMKNNEQAINNYIQSSRASLQAELQEKIDAGISPELAQLEYNQQMQNIYSNADKMQKEYMKHTTDLGNSVFGANMAILSLTNSLEFGNIMKGGWGSNRLFSKLDDQITRKVGDKAVSATAKGDEEFARGMIRGESKYESALKDPTEKAGSSMFKTGVRNMFSEGFEEGAQRFASDTEQLRASAKTQEAIEKQGLIDHALNPEVTSAMVDYSAAMTKAWSDAFDGADKSGWEEVALGAITGLLGVPMVKRKANGKFGITVMGGFSQEYRDAKQEYQKLQERIAEMNNHIDGKKLRESLLRGTANLSMLRASRMALFNDDHVLFKNIQALQSANTALFLNQQHDLGNGYSAAVDEMANNLTDEDVENYKEIKSKEVGRDKDDLFKGKTNEEVKQMIQHDMLDYKRLVERALELSDKIEKDKKAQKLTGFAHDELFSTYVLRDNITERISRIEEENSKLNEDDPIDKQQLDINNKDLTRLREDKRILDNRIEYALNNSTAFQKTIDDKVFNLQKAYMVEQNAEKVKQLQDVTSIAQIATIMQSIDVDSRDAVLDKAYEESNNNVKAIIDNYKKFEDARDTVFYKIRQIFNKKFENIRQKSIQDVAQSSIRSAEAQARIQKDEVMSNWYNMLTSEANTATMQDIQQLVETQNDEELTKKFEQFVNDFNITTNTDAAVDNIIDQNDIANQDVNRQYRELEKLMSSVYNDMIFKDQNGITGLTVADEIRDKLATLEASQSLDPSLIEDIRTVLSELDTLDKIQAISEKTKKQRDKEKKELKEQREKERKEAQKKEAKKKIKENKEEDKESEGPKKKTRKPTKQQPDKDEDGTIHYPIEDIFNMMGIVASDNVKKLATYGIRIAINPARIKAMMANSNNGNTEDILAKDLKHKELIKDFITNLSKGYIIAADKDSYVKGYLDALNKYVTDDIIEWVADTFKPTESADEEEDNIKENPSEPKEPEPLSEDVSKVNPEDYSGYNFHEYDFGGSYPMKDKNDKVVTTDDGKPKYHNPKKHALERITRSKPSLEMFADGIHPQFFVDVLLHKIISQNPDIKLRYIVRTVDRIDEETGEKVPSNNIYLGFAKRDIEETDPDILAEFDESNLSIKNTNDGEYIIFGTMGYFSKSRKAENASEAKVESPTSSIIRFNELKEKLMKDRDAFAESDNDFYVDTKLFNYVKPMSIGGEIITSTDDEKSTDEVIIDKEFLSSETRNPHHLDASNMQFVVVMGSKKDNNLRAEYVLRGLDNAEEPIFYHLNNVNKPGSTYLYVPTANGNMIPIYLNPVGFAEIADKEGLKETQWYKNLIEAAQILFNPDITDSKAKIDAIVRIRKMLIFNQKYEGKNNITMDVSYDSDTDTFRKTINRYVTVAGESSIDTEIFDSIEDFEQFLLEANPRIAIQKNQIESIDGTEYLEQLMEIGALRTNVKILGARKSTFYIYGMKKNLTVNRKATAKPKSNKHPDDKNTTVWLNRNKYIIKEDGNIYNTKDELIIDKQLIKQIEYIKRILNGKSNVFKYKPQSSRGNKKFTYHIFSKTEIYRETESGAEHYTRLEKGPAKGIYDQWVLQTNKEAKQKKIKEKLNSQPIEVKLDGSYDDEGNFDLDEPIIITNNDLVEPLDVAGEIQVTLIHKGGTTVDLFVVDQATGEESPDLVFTNVKVKRNLLEGQDGEEVKKDEVKEVKKENNETKKKEENRDIKVTYTSKRNKTLEGKYKVSTDEDGYTKAKHEGPINTTRNITKELLSELSIAYQDAFGELQSKGGFDLDAEDFESTRVSEVVIRPDGTISITCTEGVIEGEAAQKIAHELFPELFKQKQSQKKTSKTSKTEKKPTKNKEKKFTSRTKKSLDNSEDNNTFVAETERREKSTLQKNFRKLSDETKKVAVTKIAEAKKESVEDISKLTLSEKIDALYDLIKNSKESVVYDTMDTTKLEHLINCKI